MRSRTGLEHGAGVDSGDLTSIDWLVGLIELGTEARRSWRAWVVDQMKPDADWADFGRFLTVPGESSAASQCQPCQISREHMKGVWLKISCRAKLLVNRNRRNSLETQSAGTPS